MTEQISLNRQAKRKEVDIIKERIANTKGFVVFDYKGLTVLQDTEMRRTFRDQKVEYKVLKNTLVRLALNELGYKEFDLALNGPTAIAFATEDELAACKVAVESVSTYKTVQVKCGMMDKKYIDANAVEQYSKVPNKPALLSMLLSVLQAPVRSLAIALDKVAEQRG
ncbi:MAG: 50S ribosomal protein L10 [Clostridia bacterium]